MDYLLQYEPYNNTLEFTQKSRDSIWRLVFLYMKHRKYTIEWSLIGVAILVAVISVIADYYSTDYNWFARSGSVVVLLAVFVEFKVSPHIYDDIQRAQFMQTEVKMSVPFKAKPTKSRRNISFAAHILLVAGTVIWGYGDLIWS